MVMELRPTFDASCWPKFLRVEKWLEEWDEIRLNKKRKIINHEVLDKFDCATSATRDRKPCESRRLKAIAACYRVRNTKEDKISHCLQACRKLQWYRNLKED